MISKKSKTNRYWIEGDHDEIVTYEDDNLSIKFSGICPHFGGPVEFSADKKSFSCPWHAWKFDINGKCQNRKVNCNLHIYHLFHKK